MSTSIVCRLPRHVDITLEVSSGESGWFIGGKSVDNAMGTPEGLQSGDMFTQLPLNEKPSNLWTVDHVEVVEGMGGYVKVYVKGHGWIRFDAGSMVWFQGIAG